MINEKWLIEEIANLRKGNILIMTNRELLHKILDSENVILQPINKTLEQASKRTSKKRPGYIKCVTDDIIAEGLINAHFDSNNGLIGFMMFIPINEYKTIHEVKSNS